MRFYSLMSVVIAVACTVAGDVCAATPQPLYGETYRPQFHLTAAKNWHNDPNGLVFYKGEYHLFFQHNPTENRWGNMTWGHAVGPDLVHWKQLDCALLPDKLGTIFSGSAVIDWNNTAGFQTGAEKCIVCIYTSAGGTSAESKGQPFTQSLAYSNDCGRTWTKYPGNPVLKHVAASNRDPKVIWHEPSKQWVMALYLDKHDFALYGSPDLKTWHKLCDVEMPGSTECPDFFPLPVDGDANNTKWVFWAGDNYYFIGSFDGKKFVPETARLQSHWGKNRYAAQSYSDIPAADGRRIQIAWMAKGRYPGMPFNQQMSFPVELTLRSFPEGVRLCTQPIKEIEKLHGKKHAWSGTLQPGKKPLSDVRGDLFDVRLEIEPANATEVGLSIRGTPIQYNVKEQTLTCLGSSAPVKLVDGRLSLQVLVDRTSIEIFAADGRVNMAFCFLPPADNQNVTVYAQGGAAKVLKFAVIELQSIWPKP